jgi:drug/metabolite transporter (DMT)-like permease
VPLSPNLAGALFMAVSMAGFTINDTLVKYVSTSLNMGQIMLVRGAFAALFIGTIAWRQGALRELRHILHPMVLLRCVGELGGTIFFLLALAHLPIANVSAILQALPLAVTMGAALFLSEPVGWRRWVSILCGFLGVMIIVRPGFDGFSVYSVSVLACVFFCALRDLATRMVPKEVPTMLISVVTAVIVTVAGAALVQPLGGWTPMSSMQVGLLAAAASMLIVGYHFIIKSMRTGEISFIAPFRYTALLWAIVLGFAVFGDVPDLPMIVGSIIIVGSGLYMLYRERVTGRARVIAESTETSMAPDGI